MGSASVLCTVTRVFQVHWIICELLFTGLAGLFIPALKKIWDLAHSLFVQWKQHIPWLAPDYLIK